MFSQTHFLVSLLGSRLFSFETSYCSYAHGPHSVFDIGHCTVMHCDAGGVSLVDQ